MIVIVCESKESRDDSDDRPVVKQARVWSLDWLEEAQCEVYDYYYYALYRVCGWAMLRSRSGETKAVISSSYRQGNVDTVVIVYLERDLPVM
jgi:hypothetical protein